LVSTAPGPVIPRRRIAKELRTLREQRHLRLEEVASSTDVSTSTLSRLENAQGTANALTIKALVEFYDIAGTELGKNLIEWARDGRKPGWWQGDPGAANENNPSYVAYEAQASLARLYVIPYIPTLFQTRDYSESFIVATTGHRGADLNNLLLFRRRRQSNLAERTHQAPLGVHAILHESCLTQQVGSSEVMHDQLAELLRIGRELRDHVTIQVLPQSSPPHRATTCAWSHFEYAPDLDGVLFTETHVGLIPYEDKDLAAAAVEDFRQLVELSLTPQESLEMIRATMQRYVQ
jgi:transcriptional regulator with XRE-family HTH domain